MEGTVPRTPSRSASSTPNTVCAHAYTCFSLALRQVTNWFENAEDALKKKAVPKAAFLDDFFSGKS